jgi:hypothetical protein
MAQSACAQIRAIFRYFPHPHLSDIKEENLRIVDSQGTLIFGNDAIQGNHWGTASVSARHPPPAVCRIPIHNVQHRGRRNARAGDLLYDHIPIQRSRKFSQIASHHHCHPGNRASARLSGTHAPGSIQIALPTVRCSWVPHNLAARDLRDDKLCYRFIAPAPPRPGPRPATGSRHCRPPRPGRGNSGWP